MIINRVHVPYFLCGIMLTWAAISIATGLVQSYAGLKIVRFFLGVGPSILYRTS